MMCRPARTKTLYFWLILGLCIVVPVGIIIFLTDDFYTTQQLYQSGNVLTEKKQTPLLHIIDGVFHEVEPDCRYELNIHAQHADIMRNSSRILCTEINGVFFDKDRKEIRFSAQQGIIAQDEKTIHFPKNLDAIFNNGTFKGNNITYHLDKYELSSQQPFIFNHPLITFQATSGTMNLKDYESSLNGGVSTTITPPDKQPPL